MKVKNLLSMMLVAGMMLVGCQNGGQAVDQSTEIHNQIKQFKKKLQLRQ